MLSRGKKTFIRKLERRDVVQMTSWGEYGETFLKDYSFPKLSGEEVDIWLKMKTKNFKRCFAILSEQKKLIGYISLRNINFILKRAEMGIVIGPDYVGKGYGTDAIKAFLRYYFKKMRYKKLTLTVASYNKRAYKCYLSCGFKFVENVYLEIGHTQKDAIKDCGFDKEIIRTENGKNEALFWKMEISTISTE